MTWFQDLFLTQGIGWAATLGELAVRSTVLLAVAGVLAVLLRRRPATVRHRVWTLALGGVLSLPLIGLVVPALPLSVPLPTLTSPSPSPVASGDDGFDGAGRTDADGPAVARRAPAGSTRGLHGSTEAGSKWSVGASAPAPGTANVAARLPPSITVRRPGRRAPAKPSSAFEISGYSAAAVSTASATSR